MAFRVRSPELKTPPADQTPNSAPRPVRSRAIGALLVDAGRLTQADVEEIEAHADKNGLRFGDAALQLNKVSPGDIESALARQFNYTLLPHGAQDGVSDAVIAAYEPQADVVEDLRTIRSRLALGWLNDTTRNVLAITSPQRGEGRSWFAANLATVFAQAGERTLLIDADMRHPQQHQLFNLKNDVGLSALLTGRAGREIVQRVHPQLRLFVVTAGLMAPNPLELLTREVFDFVLERYASQFDLVVLDTPAATDSSDAEILAARAGAAILLTRRHNTHRRKLLEAMACLQRSGAKVIGSVVNEY
jgi:receptor protein-tyrosine kinase